MDELRERIGERIAELPPEADVEEIVEVVFAEIGRTHAVVPKELTRAMLHAGAHCITGACVSNCCHRTGGHGDKPPESGCDCQDAMRGAWEAALKAATPPASTGGGEGG